MKTFILMWNPSISSYTWDRFKEDQKEMCEHDYSEGVGNWSIWEHEEAEEGDRFFMVKVGPGKTGIVMAGYFYSDPYEDEDWSGHGRQTYYCDLNIEQQIDPDLINIITTDQLMAELPGFDWTKGHSGRVLNPESAIKLELLWLKYIAEKRGTEIENAVYNSEYDIFLNETLTEYFRKTKGETCEICGYNYKEIFGEDSSEYVEHDIYVDDFISREPSFKLLPIPGDVVINRIRCICSNCRKNNGIYKKLF